MVSRTGVESRVVIRLVWTVGWLVGWCGESGG